MKYVLVVLACLALGGCVIEPAYGPHYNHHEYHDFWR